MNPLIQLKQTTSAFLVALGLACFGLSQALQAVSPPPDGGYPNFTTAEGDNALKALTAGEGNTAVGTFSLFSVSTGNFNTAVGAGSLDLNTADSNTAVGTAALLFNTTGTENTASGTAALEFNGTGSDNAATGAFALLNNTTGFENTAIGFGALENNTTGGDDTAVGDRALQSNTTADRNTAIGVDTLTVNTTGDRNTAVGMFALNSNTTGSFNIAIGGQALGSNTTGSNSTALGFGAGSSVMTASNVICIGQIVGADVSNTCFIDNIRGVTTVNNNATPVLIDSAGQLGTASSSCRYKTDIKPIDKASVCVLGLKPVTFRYKMHKDRTPQFGLIAEDVAKINPDLVIYDADGQPYTVRYDAVNAMLLNEFLKEHRKNEKQEATIARLEKQVEALTAGLQKVSAQLEVNKSTPQTVLNNQ
jgi:hypothetical protein